MITHFLTSHYCFRASYPFYNSLQQFAGKPFIVISAAYYLGPFHNSLCLILKVLTLLCILCLHVNYVNLYGEANHMAADGLLETKGFHVHHIKSMSNTSFIVITTQPMLYHNFTLPSHSVSCTWFLCIYLKIRD